jgi:hypothetical protein
MNQFKAPQIASAPTNPFSQRAPACGDWRPRQYLYAKQRRLGFCFLVPCVVSGQRQQLFSLLIQNARIGAQKLGRPRERFDDPQIEGLHQWEQLFAYSYATEPFVSIHFVDAKANLSLTTVGFSVSSPRPGKERSTKQDSRI